jgi:hypothetical protein
VILAVPVRRLAIDPFIKFNRVTAPCREMMKSHGSSVDLVQITRIGVRFGFFKEIGYPRTVDQPHVAALDLGGEGIGPQFFRARDLVGEHDEAGPGRLGSPGRRNVGPALRRALAPAPMAVERGGRISGSVANPQPTVVPARSIRHSGSLG